MALPRGGAGLRAAGPPSLAACVPCPVLCGRTAGASARKAPALSYLPNHKASARWKVLRERTEGRLWPASLHGDPWWL